jgi:transposase
MTSKTTNEFSPEVRARALRMVLGHESEHPLVTHKVTAPSNCYSQPRNSPSPWKGATACAHFIAGSIAMDAILT